jgi:hypothetical protein
MALLAILALAVLIAAGCRREPEVVTEEVTREVTVEVTREVVQEIEVTRVVEQEVQVEVTVEVPVEPEIAIPFAEAWVSSPHADTEAEAFRHWDEDDPAVVSASCAQCHSTPGYRDYVGADGTEAGVVDSEAPIGTVVECIACHNEATLNLTSVTFPSGVEIMDLGDQARCMVCHQGRASKASVDNGIEEAGLADSPDESSEELGFINIHYYAAAATRFGTFTEGGYQYDGKSYDALFGHVEGYDTCDTCHDPHTLEVQVEQCSTCHTDVSSTEGFRNVRLVGSTVDHDGDGDASEGIAFEIEGLQEILIDEIQAYAQETVGTAIVYDVGSYPYFFIDSNANGEVDDGEAAYPNRYNAWTPRLLKAAYNYQTSLKDPGGYAHGGKYMIELLYDSIEDLNAEAVEGLARIDAGHFAGSEEAFRHWDEDGEVPGRCSRCHSATGLPTFLAEGADISQPLSNGFQCVTCHDAMPEFTRYEVGAVTFPSGAQLDTGSSDANLCLNCHQGRESTVSVNRVIAGLDPDTPSEDVGFRNVHYFAAGATLFGGQAQGAYQYEGQEYVGRFGHVSAYDTCIECHDAHTLELQEEECTVCHDGIDDPHEIRLSETDFDGDGNVEEGLSEEVATMREMLYAALQAYAADVLGAPIIYDGHSYPYFFNDSNGNGQVDEGEANFGNRYASWSPRLLQAAYNYQYAAKDPGAFAHNGQYVLQVLYDSLSSLASQVPVDMEGMVRPEAE